MLKKAAKRRFAMKGVYMLGYVVQCLLADLSKSVCPLRLTAECRTGIVHSKCMHSQGRGVVSK